jgi:hypothetical protein
MGEVAGLIIEARFELNFSLPNRPDFLAGMGEVYSGDVGSASGEDALGS